MVMTGQAKIASARQVAIVTRSEKISNALRARGGSSEITTSMRMWRPAQPTGPAPRKTQPIIRNSIASSAHDSDADHFQHVVHCRLAFGCFVAHRIEQRLHAGQILGRQCLDGAAQRGPVAATVCSPPRSK